MKRPRSKKLFAIAWRRGPRRLRPVLIWLYPRRRLAALITAIALMASIILPVVSETTQAQSYVLSATASKIVKPTDSRLMKQVTFDAAKQTYQFNKAASVPDSPVPAQTQTASLGTPGDSKSATFAADLPTTLKNGVTYHDVNSQLSFTMTPQYTTSAGESTGGRLVYPIPGGMQAVYTLKANGVKEDIVVEHTGDASLNFAYTLNLPKTLAAKMTANGSIGIYSADPSLFGNINFGSDADKARVQLARENGDKTNLVFMLPAPIVTGANGKQVPGTSAHFTLAGNKVTVTADGLNTVTGPVSIDPSVVITTTSDFTTSSNNEGMIDYSIPDQINRSNLTGGTVGTWTATSSMLATRSDHQTVAYHGYLYALGGLGAGRTTPLSAVEYAPINSDGTVGTWVATTALPNTIASGASALYNGYIYMLGGSVGGADSNTVYYSAINADGTLGAWSTTTSFTNARVDQTSAVYNDTVYVMGGNQSSSGSAVYNDVQYAPIHGDGTLGAWTTTSAFTTARENPAASAYNGYVYIGGGYSGSTYLNDVQRASINPDGTLGAWSSLNSFTTGRQALTMTAYNGYLYIMGGGQGKNTQYSDVQYAQLNADGTVGTWATTSPLDNTKMNMGTASLNGYIYMTGGLNKNSSYNTTIYTKIDTPGSTAPFATSSTSTPATRSMMCTAAYGGYVYALGGSTTNNGQSNQTTIYAATISNAGVLGAWSSITAALPTATSAMGCTIYNGYIYIAGGYTGTAAATTAVRYATVSGTTIGTWTTAASALPAATVAPGVFTYTASGGTTYLYVVGGSIAGSYYTPLSATGATGTWTTGASLPDALTSRSYAQIGNVLYAMGGLNGTTAATTVYSGMINADGTMAAWTSSGVAPLNTAVASMNGGVSVNGCLYVVGGQTGGTTPAATSTVQYTCPASNGTIAAWTTSGQSLTTSIMNMGVVAYDSYILGVGGYTGSAYQGTTQIAHVNNGGDSMTGANGTTTTAMTTNGSTASPRYFHFTVAYNGYLYALGGYTGSAYLNTVIYAPISGGGVVGTWASTTSFANARAYESVAVYNGVLYLTGGYNGTTFYSDYQYATVQSDGTLGNWSAAGSIGTTPQPRATHGSVAYNGYLYVEGGLSTTTNYLTSVQYAPINSDGSLGTWVTSAVTLPVGRATSVAVAYNGYIYILGGRTSSTTYINTVLVSQIQSTGDVGAFNYTTSFKNNRNYLGTAVANGRIYIFGGWDGTTYYQDIQYAIITGNGTLGPWQNAGNMSSGRYGVSAVYYNGYMYVTGGNAAGTAASTVDYLPIRSIQRVGRYTKLLDAGNAVGAISGFIINGLVPGQNGALSYRSAASDGIFSTTNNLSTDYRSQTCSTVSRYVLLVLVLDDSGELGGGAGVFPDASSTAAYTTDITIKSKFGHPPPDIRLRHGSTMQLGALSPLDTCNTIPG